MNFDIDSEYTTFTANNRLVHAPSAKLKSYHRFLNSCVFEYASINENVVFSYRKKVNTYDAVKRHALSKYFFQTDISNFFTSLKSQDVERVFDRNLEGTPVIDIKKYKNRLLGLLTLNGELPVGFSTSPFVSNSCLLEFDNELETYCLQNKIIYTRYSDDLILSTSDETALLSIDKIITGMLNSLFGTRLLLNPLKTKHTHKGNKLKLLGVVILPTGKITVDMKIKKNIEALLHFYINDKDKFIDLVGGDYDKGLSKVSGTLNYINTIDNTYLNKLRKKYGNTIVDMFFHKSVQ